MFAQNACAPAAHCSPTASVPPVALAEPKVVHLMLVRTPRFTPRGLAWLQRSPHGEVEFDGLQLQRLIRMEKLSLG